MLEFMYRYFIEKETVTNQTEINKLQQLLERNSELLTKEHPECAQRFDRYQECLSEYLYLKERQDFCMGFSIGAELMAEVFYFPKK